MSESNDKQARTWGMLCHLTALSMFVAVPFGHIIGPLVIWLIKKDESDYIDAQGKEALNFNISMTIYYLVAGLMFLVLIGVIILPLLFVAHLVFIIIGSVKSSDGELYQYPLTIRLIQ